MPWTETKFFRQVRLLGLGGAPRTQVRKRSKKVLIYAIRQDRDQVAMSLTMALALRQRGQRSFVTGCDGALRKSCNTGHYPLLNYWECRTCEHYAREAHRRARLPHGWLGNTLPMSKRKIARSAVARLPVSDFKNYIYRGLPIGTLVRQSVAHFLRTDRIMEQPESVETYREWLVAGQWLVDTNEYLLDQYRPEVVFLFNGLFAPERIMLELALRRGIRVVSYEVGFRPQTFFFQHDRPTDMCDNSHWPRFSNLPLNEIENALLDDYLAQRSTGGGYLLNYFPKLMASHNQICSTYGINPQKKTFVLFPNITWDSTLFEKNVGFTSMADWIDKTIRFFADHPEGQLVIRVHPAEVILPGSRRDSVIELIQSVVPVLPANVIVIPPDSGASSYILMEMADCALVYGSTTGLEAGVRGVPVIVAGQIYYRNLGFTFDATSPKTYIELLTAVLSGIIKRNDPTRMEAWRRYGYFAIFRSAICLPHVHYPNVGVSPTLDYTTPNDLDVGRDPNLDVVCDGIIHGSPFLAARVVA